MGGRGAGNGGKSPTSVITGGDGDVKDGDVDGTQDGGGGGGGLGGAGEGREVDDGVGSEDDGGGEYGGGEYGGGAGITLALCLCCVRWRFVGVVYVALRALTLCALPLRALTLRVLVLHWRCVVLALSIHSQLSPRSSDSPIANSSMIGLTWRG